MWDAEREREGRLVEDNEVRNRWVYYRFSFNVILAQTGFRSAHEYLLLQQNLEWPILCHMCQNHSIASSSGVSLQYCYTTHQGPLHTLGWEPVTIALQALSLVGNGGAGPSSLLHTTYAWGTDGVCMWMQDGCRVYMGSYGASNGSCFMVTRTVFKNHLMEVSLTQNRETMALWMLTTNGLFCFIMCEKPYE